MKPITIKISTKTDTEPQFPELQKAADEGRVVETEVTRMGILEGGMASGRTSIALIADLPDGKHVLIQMSAGQLINLAAAAKGAAARFGEVL